MERQHMFEIQHFYKNGTLLDNIDNLTDEFIKNVVVEELNETLHALHQFEEGYSHNDVKPHNIFLTDDKKHIVLGDFGISKNLKGKKYLTKKDAKMTLMYAGPECDETTTRECDYYSFGITLLHLGFRDDPFKGISNHKIRMSRHQYQLFIPDEIDSDLADLIYMLTKYASFERANYEDVLKWVKKPNVFKGKRNQKDLIVEEDDIPIDEYRFPVENVTIKFFNIIELTEAFNNNFTDALKHYENNFILEAIKKYNPSIFLELKDIFEKYFDNPEIGLLLTLHRLNKKLNFKFNKTEIHTYEELIYKIKKGSKDSILLNTDIIMTLFKKFNLPESAIETLKGIIEAYKNKQDIMDMIVNRFDNNEDFTENGKDYKDFNTFLKQRLFDGFKANDISIETSNKKFFYKMIHELYGGDESKFKDMITIKSSIERYEKLGLIYLGYVPIKISGIVIDNLKTFFDANVTEFEKGNTKDIITYFQKGYFDHLVKHENSSHLEIINKLDKYPIEEKPIVMYHFYKVDHTYKGCKDIKSLTEFLEKQNDLEKISEEIIHDIEFKIWLESMGYQI
jgi:serine/threonine protein kinase